MVNSIIGLGLCVFGIYNVVLSNYNTSIDTTPLWWIKHGTAIVVGGCIFLYNIYPHAVLALTNFKFPKKDKIMSGKDLGPDISIKSEQEQDIATLFWLSERLKNDPEGLELCRQLHDKLFSLHHKKQG